MYHSLWSLTKGKNNKDKTGKGFFQEHRHFLSMCVFT